MSPDQIRKAKEKEETPNKPDQNRIDKNKNGFRDKHQMG